MLLSSRSVWCCSAPRSGLSHACFPLGGGENRTDLGLQRCCCCYWQMVTALPVGFCSTSPLPGILLLSLSCMSSRTLSLFIYLCCLLVTCLWCSMWLWCTSLRATHCSVCEGAPAVSPTDGQSLWHPAAALAKCICCTALLVSVWSDAELNQPPLDKLGVVSFHKAPEIAGSGINFILVFSVSSGVTFAYILSCVLCLGENWFIYISLVAMIGMNLLFAFLVLILHFWDCISYIHVNGQSPLRFWGINFSSSSGDNNRAVSLLIQYPERCYWKKLKANVMAESGTATTDLTCWLALVWWTDWYFFRDLFESVHFVMSSKGERMKWEHFLLHSSSFIGLFV